MLIHTVPAATDLQNPQVTDHLIPKKLEKLDERDFCMAIAFLANARVKDKVYQVFYYNYMVAIESNTLIQNL